MISAKDLSYQYEENDNIIKVLNNLDFDIKDGEFVCIIGHNGSGKSTLAKLFNAIYLPSGGKVYVDNFDTSDENLLYEIRQRVGMVFQNPDNQIVATIVEEDVAFGPENLGFETKEIRKRVDDALKTVNMYAYKDHAPHMLSGGQKQRIAIAGILAMRPKVMIFDESTAMLDPVGRKEIIDTVIKLNKEYNITVIMITHYMAETINADRIFVLDKGKIAVSGTPKEIFSTSEILEKYQLDLPVAAKISLELKKKGIDIDNCLSVEEFNREFERIINK